MSPIAQIADAPQLAGRLIEPFGRQVVAHPQRVRVGLVLAVDFTARGAVIPRL
jgi:hypothetical protein